MIDKNLLRLLGGNKKYIFYCVAYDLMIDSSIGVDASVDTIYTYLQNRS